MNPGDDIALSRGFREVIPHLETKGFEVLIPNFKRQKKLTCKEANQADLLQKPAG